MCKWGGLPAGGKTDKKREGVAESYMKGRREVACEAIRHVYFFQ
jgi:hypothetical protein